MGTTMNFTITRQFSFAMVLDLELVMNERVTGSGEAQGHLTLRFRVILMKIVDGDW
jgi:hypothetical protein